MLYSHNLLFDLIECLFTEEEGTDAVTAGYEFAAAYANEQNLENCLWFHCPEADPLLNALAAAEDPDPHWKLLYSLLESRWPQLDLHCRFGCPHQLFEQLLLRIQGHIPKKVSPRD